MKSNIFSGVGILAVIESAQLLCLRVRILEDSKENKRHAGQVVQGRMSFRLGMLEGSRSSSRWPRERWMTFPSYTYKKV